MGQNEKKKRVALAALEHLRDGATLGVGTGTTVDHFIAALAGQTTSLGAVVSSSERSTARLRDIGIDVVDLASVGELDLYVDGADEATKHMHLIKGGGGALTREKILAGAARRFVCIIDDSKLVAQLGRFPVPIEVIPMARLFVSKQILKAGGRPLWREGFITDNGNHIIDVHDWRIGNPIELETRINQIPGVVTVGIFAHRHADVLLVAGDTEVRTIR
ncbi:MAG TPA: ribose-5-phosphate isomerase RpiA [Gammaproteobacteria bacterium]|jgi:ribose 5-phosphate isomerase A